MQRGLALFSRMETEVSALAPRLSRMGVINTGTECGLSRRQISEVLNVRQRTWLVDDALLETLDSDLQAVVNCTDEGDTIVFQITEILKLPRRVEIPWRLKLDTAVGDTSDSEETAPVETDPTVIRCRRNRGAFIVRNGVEFANLAFTNCSLDTRGDRAIIEVEECDSESETKNVLLDHVTFRGNRLNESSAVLAANASCTSVELVDVSFVGNKCSGVCFAHLSLTNDLRNVVMENNSRLVDDKRIPVMISLPVNSNTTASVLTARGNSVTALNASGNTLELRASRFLGNADSSVIVLNAATEVSISDCGFSHNEASDIQGAAISATQTDFVEISDCTFSGNLARAGGAFAIFQSRIRVQDSLFKNNKAIHNGGAVELGEESVLVLTESQILGNEAEKRGGGIRCSMSNITAHDLRLRNNKAKIHGGGISAEDDCNVTLSQSNVIGNVCTEFGGGVAVRSGSSATFDKMVFQRNRAGFAGGSVYTDDSSLDVNASQFSRNRAARGGSIASRLSDIVASSVTFRQDKAEIAGGSINALWRCRLSFNDVSVISSESKTGAGLYISRSLLRVSNLKAVRNNATENGGGLHAGFNSSVLCSSCIFEDNSAGFQGGGVSLNATRPQLLAYQFVNSSFTRNRADLGGAFFFLSQQHTEDCSRSGANCTFAALIGSRLSGNSAKSGGAFFVSNPETLRYECHQKPQKNDPEDYFMEDFVEMRTLRNSQSACSEWKDNRAEILGDLAASYARAVLPFVKDSNSDSFVEWNGTVLHVNDYKSGDALPPIRLEVVDGFGQGPVAGNGNSTVEAIMWSTDRFFVGNISVLLDGGQAEIAEVIGFQRGGSYNVTIDFSEDVLPSLTIIVSVRSCSFGESSEANGTFCSLCSESQFNFDPEEKCQSCPENGDCSSKTAILPRSGYWHSCPCSQRIQECPIKAACDFEKRREQLTNLTRGLNSCEGNDTFFEQYSRAQCREGYKDALCGSCADTHGRARSLECAECQSKQVNILLYVFSMALLLLLSSFAIRSNLTSRSLRSATTLSFYRRNPRHSSDPLGSARYVQMAYRPHPNPETRVEARHAARNTNEDERSLRQAKLLKQKIVEIFKVTFEHIVAQMSLLACTQIAVNFLQVVAVAVSINVNWTKGMISLFSTADFFGSAATAGLSLPIDCFLPSESSTPRSVLRIVFLMVIPVMNATFFVVFWAVAVYRFSETWSYFCKRLLLSCLVIMYLAYVPITKTAAHTLFCVQVYESCDGSAATNRFWAMDTSVNCYEGSHAVLTGALSLPVLVLLSLGFPATLALVLTCKVQPEPAGDAWLAEAMGFLYRAYDEKLAFWESVVMLRKSLLAVIVASGFVLDGNVQGILAICVLTIALYIQTLLSPFKEEFGRLNDYEAASLAVCLLTFAAGLLFNNDTFGDEFRILLSICLLMLIIGLSFFFLFQLTSLAGSYSRIVLQANNVEIPSSWGRGRVLCELLSLRMREQFSYWSQTLVPPRTARERNRNVI